MKKEKREQIILVVGIILVLLGATYSILNQPIIKYADENDLPDDCIEISVDERETYNDTYYIPFGNCSSCFKKQIEIRPKDKPYALYGDNAKEAADFMKDIGFTDLYIVRSYENE